MAIIGIILGSLSILAWIAMIIISLANVGFSMLGPVLFNGNNYNYYGF